MTGIGENLSVVFIVYVLMGFAIAPTIKLFLTDGTQGQITVTQVMAMVLGVLFVFVYTGIPSTADGVAWGNSIGVGIISGLAAIGVHARVGSPLPTIQTIASRRRTAQQAPYRAPGTPINQPPSSVTPARQIVVANTSDATPASQV